MTAKKPREVEWCELIDHPSVAAVRHLTGETLTPTRIRALKPDRPGKTAVFRIHRGRQEPALIAKRSAAGRLDLEAHVYRHVLPLLDVGHLTLEAAGDWGGWQWLVLEDAGDEYPDPTSEEDVQAVVEWCRHIVEASGCLDSNDRSRLPVRGLAHHRQSVETLIDRLAAGVEVKNATLITDLAGQLERLLDAWPAVESADDRIPDGFVHGDLSRKNIRLRSRDGERACLVFDWEMAGWGSMLPDLAALGDAIGGRVVAAISRRGRAEPVGDAAVALRLVQACGWECEVAGWWLDPRAIGRLSGYTRDLRSAVDGLQRA